MSPSKFVKSLVVSFIVLFVIDFLWHGVIFGSFYTGQLVSFARSSGGKLAGLVPFMLLADVLAALAYSYVLPLSAAANRKYVLNGAILGLALAGAYTFTNVALLPGWNIKIALVDVAYGIIAGAILGYLQKFLNRSQAV